MSFSYQPLEPILVRDPRTILKNKRDFAVLKGGSEVNTKIYTSTSISTSSIQFSTPPPSGNVIVDRKVFMNLPVRLTFTAVAGGGNVLQSGLDAPRQFPFSSSCDTLRVSLNGLAMTIDMADVIHALQHFNTDAKLKARDYSGSPNCPDQSQNYSDLLGTNRNPLAFYGDTLDETVPSRGGFSFNIVSNTDTSAVVDMVIHEPIFLNPLYWGCGNSSGFINVNEMDWNITFLQNAGNRMWSHNNANKTITNIAVQFSNFTGPAAFSYVQNQPTLEFTYISQNQNDLFPVHQPSTYPYFDIVRYPTDIAAIPFNNTLTSQQVTSNNIQLSSIPRRMYIYVRPRNSSLYTTPDLTDTYYGISALNIQFDNRAGLLSGASQYQLYQMAIKNHCDMSWEQWSGQPVFTTGAFSGGAGPFTLADDKFGPVGSILCIEFGADIGLRDDEAPGISGQYQLLVQAQVYNCDPTGAHDAIPLSMYIVIVNEGSLTIPGYGHAINQIGVISKSDVLTAKRNPFIDYQDIQEVNGGNFLSGLKHFGQKVAHAIREAAPYAKAAYKYGKKAAPYIKEGLEIAEAVAPLLAAGEVVGEGRMSRKSLKSRMRRI